MHTEAVHYYHHAAMLEAHDKTLNRYTHKGVEIRQKVNGYNVSGRLFPSLEIATQSIDREQAFTTFHNGFEYNVFLCLWCENCIRYKFGNKQYEDAVRRAMQLVKDLKLPLLATTPTIANDYSLTLIYIRP